MGLFQNDFFSIAGQKERLGNVVNTLSAAVGIKGGGVVSNTGNKTIDSALGAAASHPFVSAAVVATVINPMAAGTVAKKAVSSLASSFGSASLGQKAAVVVAAPVVASALAASPSLRSGLVSAPASLSNFGTNLGSLAENPSLSNLTKIAKENPVIAAAAAAGGLLIAGSAVRGVASIAATALNTSAVKANTATSSKSNDTVLTSNPELYPSSVAGESNLVAPVTDSSIKSPMLPVQGSSKSRKRRKKTPIQSVNQSVRVNITDDRDNIDRKVFKQVRR
jgi:hypothetical protein